MWMTGVVAALALTGCAHEHGHAEHQAGFHHRFDDPAKWAREFEDPNRDAWQKPDEVIAALDLPKDARVADIGAATGYFAVRIARSHPDATVYGVDIEPQMVSYLDDRAKNEKLPNLNPVLGAPDDPKLPERVDLALVVDTFHHIDDRSQYFAHLAQTQLTPDGRVAIIDFKKGVAMGPPDQHKLAPEEVVSEMKQAGFCERARPTFLEYQYMLVFGRCAD